MSGRFKKDFLFKFIGDSADLERSVQRAERSLGGMDGKVSGSNKAFAGLGKAAGALGGLLAAGAFANGVKAAVGRAEEMNSLYAITEQVISQTGGAAGVTAVQVQGMAEEMSKTTGLDKSVATEAANVLLTFTNLKREGEGVNDIFGRAHDITADMATVFGGSAVDAAKQLGKALNDPIGGVSALSRVGVQFTDQQKTQIKTLVESGDVLGAQKIILGELETQVGGTADASADATAQMGNAFDEIVEAIGQNLLPAIEAITPSVVSMAEGVADGISQFGLGVQAVDRFTSSIGDAIGGIFGMEESWTDADEALFAFTKVHAQMVDELKEGKDAGQIAGEVMIHLARSGNLTEDTMARIVETTGITTDRVASLRRGISELSDDLDLGTDAMEQIDDVTRSYADQAARDAVAAEEDLAESARDHAAATMAAARAQEEQEEATDNLRGAMKELVDPVFRAEEATRRYEQALADAKEDGELTRDEIMKVTEAYVGMKEAGEKLNPQAIEAYGDMAQEALGLTDQEARDAALSIDALAHIDMSPGMRALSDVAGRLEAVTGKTIRVDVSQFKLATQAEIDQAVMEAVWSAQRSGKLIPV